MPETSGILVLVVGPSGAGKDSVMRGAAEKLVGNPRYAFPRRVVTRQPDTVAEDHDSMSEAEFSLALARGEFMLFWQAHGNHYGIPKCVADQITAGHVAVINVSRHILHDAANSYPHLVIAEVTADADIRIARIQNRGRELADDAAKRASRETPPFPPDIKVIRIENNGAVEDAVAAFTDALRLL